MFCPHVLLVSIFYTQAGSTGLPLEQLHLCPQIPGPQEGPIHPSPAPSVPLPPQPCPCPCLGSSGLETKCLPAPSGGSEWPGPGFGHSSGAHLRTRRCLSKVGPGSWDSLWGLLTTPRLQSVPTDIQAALLQGQHSPVVLVARELASLWC